MMCVAFMGWELFCARKYFRIKIKRRKRRLLHIIMQSDNVDGEVCVCVYFIKCGLVWCDFGVIQNTFKI